MEPYKSLLESILAANGIEELEKVLSRNPISRANKNWIVIGDDDDNFSGVIENQQSTAENAFVEKLTNAIDAVNMKECLKRGIDPRGSHAPADPFSAATEFNVFDSENQIVIESKRIKLNRWDTYLKDQGEGQEPGKFKETFLSVLKSNKKGIPFTHGQFNQGGLGVISHCPKGYHLILSKRHKDLNPEDERVGFTVTRINSRTGDLEYLTDNGCILTTEKVDLLNEGGTIIKLFDYFDHYLKYYHVNFMMPKTPIKIRTTNSYEDTVYCKGIIPFYEKYLHVNKDEKIINTEFGKIYVSIYVNNPLQKRNHSSDYKRNLNEYLFPSKKGVLFLNFGQVQGVFDRNWFRKKEFDFNQLRRHLCVFLDCSEIPFLIKKRLFMADRERLRINTFTGEIKEKLIAILSENKMLLELEKEIRNNALKNATNQEDLIKELIDSKTINQLTTVEGVDVLIQKRRYKRAKDSDQADLEIKDYSNKPKPKKNDNNEDNKNKNKFSLPNITFIEKDGKRNIWIKEGEDVGIDEPFKEVWQSEKNSFLILMTKTHKTLGDVPILIYINKQSPNYLRITKALSKEYQGKDFDSAMDYRRIQIFFSILKFCNNMLTKDLELKKPTSSDLSRICHNFFLTNPCDDFLIKSFSMKDFIERNRESNIHYRKDQNRFVFSIDREGNHFNRSFKIKAEAKRFKNFFLSKSKKDQILLAKKAITPEELGWG